MWWTPICWYHGARWHVVGSDDRQVHAAGRCNSQAAQLLLCQSLAAAYPSVTGPASAPRCPTPSLLLLSQPLGAGR